MEKKNIDLAFLGVLVAIATFSFSAGLHWGLPSAERNSLYFTRRDSLRKTLQEIEDYKLEEAWKGMGPYLVVHPEEEGRKLPRSLYNPIRSYHPDEYFVLKSLASMNPEELDFNPHQYGVGGAYLYPVGIVIFLASRFQLIKIGRDISFAFSHPEELAKLYLCGRILTGLYGLAAIILFFFLSRRLLQSRILSLLATWLLMWTPLVVLNTHYMYVDIPALFWAIATLYFTLNYLQTPQNRWLAFAGLSAGLAFGSKISLLVVIFIPVMGLLLERPNAFQGIRYLLLVLLAFSAGFIFTNPYFVLTFPEPLIDLGQHSGWSFQGKFYLKSLTAGLGWPLFIFAGIGHIFALLGLVKKNNHRSAVCLLFLWDILFFLFISCFSKTFARYLLPLVPGFILTGIWGWTLVESLTNPFGKTFTRSLALVVSSLSFCCGLYFLSFFLKENVRTRAGRWIKENLPAGSTLGTPEIPWQFQMPDFDESRYLIVVTGYSLASFQQSVPNYFVLSSFQAPIAPYPLKLNREKLDFWKEFHQSGWYKPVKIFSPDKPFGANWCLPETLPEDLIYLFPTIAIFERVKK
ncbi:MAG: glycosyltransferase family 39 protein [Candidatus Omnitrophica bacterium]|nr:glycosyltransferase family 39 protein [Candidatus Omnitrophota bacterium]